MPRAPPGLSLLLMAALAFAATPPLEEENTPPLETINPWLSACDLQPDSATDLKGACSAMWGPGSLCLPPCPPNSTTQCLLYLEESHKEKVCGLSPEHRRRALHNLRMRHCCEHAVDLALPDKVLQADSKTCRYLLDALLKVDALAARISCEFAEVLYRYDCGQKYSIKHQCEDCKEAYRRWVCSSMVPHYREGQRIRPCIRVCQDVEQKCPYFLPGDRAPAHPTQYAGEPTFLCLDPNIPETGNQRKKSTFGDEDCCYTHCGTPGRGRLCSMNCTGRSANDTAEPVKCPAGLGTSTSSCRLGTSSSASRTLNKVLPLWTAWITLTQINTIYNILQCLLVMCATSVRTSLTRRKTKWRLWS